MRDKSSSRRPPILFIPPDLTKVVGVSLCNVRDDENDSKIRRVCQNIAATNPSIWSTSIRDLPSLWTRQVDQQSYNTYTSFGSSATLSRRWWFVAVNTTQSSSSSVLFFLILCRIFSPFIAAALLIQPSTFTLDAFLLPGKEEKTEISAQCPSVIVNGTIQLAHSTCSCSSLLTAKKSVTRDLEISCPFFFILHLRFS